ncbi:laforin-like [Vidua chalybeata]|uniref:laforin-like n=1 Tax=Vidua chalybeata TaxID=81927 RepID=UPI0023A7EDE3|nr:laforin-like [Vidua chalybeata]
MQPGAGGRGAGSFVSARSPAERRGAGACGGILRVSSRGRPGLPLPSALPAFPPHGTAAEHWAREGGGSGSGCSGERGKQPHESVSLCIRLRAEAATIARRRGEGEKRLLQQRQPGASLAAEVGSGAAAYGRGAAAGEGAAGAAARPSYLVSRAAGCRQAAGRQKSCLGRPGATPRGGDGDPARVPALLAAARGRRGAAADRPRRAWDGLSPGPAPEALGRVVLQVLFSLPLRCFSDCGCRCVRVRKYRHQRLSFFPAEQPQKRSSFGPLQPPPPRGSQGGPVPVPAAGLRSARSVPPAGRACAGGDPGQPLSSHACPCVRAGQRAAMRRSPASCEDRLSRFVSFSLPRCCGTGARRAATDTFRPSPLPSRSCAASAAKCAGERDLGSKSPDRK